ncbi:hypothetical protein G9A89_010707 [Geosiphon pyriformis]|nr:hypothetical protein G9A89_010707 [Geosiphon pyriformis]
MARGNSFSRSSTASKEEKPCSQFYHEECFNPSSKHTLVDWTATEPPSFVTICEVSQILRNKMERQEIKEEKSDSCINPLLLQMDNEGIGTIRKPSLFSTQVTETEQDIIDKRVALQQRQYAEFERRELERKSTKIRAVFEFVSDEEIKESLKDCENDEEEVIVRMTQPGYLIHIRKMIAQKYHGQPFTNHMSDEQKEAYEQLLKKRKETLRKTTGENAKKQYRMKGRLALDDALKQVLENKKDLEKAFEGWSEARIKAFNAIDSKPNTYYYRFNAPGEVQKKGQWTKEEEALFFARLEEIGSEGQWGIFSMAIPGRVGYQCSNFYRLLIETGRLEDPNYVLDEKGKAHYLFSTKNKVTGETEKTFRTHSKHGGGSAPRPSRPSPSKTTSRSNPVKKRRKKSSRFNSDDDSAEEDFDFDDSGSYTLKSWSGTKRSITRSSGIKDIEMYDIIEEDSNPLPGFVDPITLEEVIKPAISPYGHVMGYDSWVRCLCSDTQKNICPLTKKPLNKRELIILTKDNIEQYRNQVVNKETNPFVVDLAASMSGTDAKKKSSRVLTSGSVSSGSSHKVKKPPGSAKLSSNSVALKDSGSGQVIGQFNSMDTEGEASKGEEVFDSKMNTPQAKRFNNGVIVGSSLGSINFDMEEEKEVSLPSCRSFSLDKMWIDPKIIKTQVKVAVKKSFALDINLSAVEKKLATAKTHVIRKLFSRINGFGGATTPSKFEGIIRSIFTSEASIEKATSLARENDIIVNNNLKKQGIRSDWAVVIKEIPIDMPKDMIVTAVSKFGEIKSIKIQLIGIWQKAVVEFAEPGQAEQLASK